MMSPRSFLLPLLALSSAASAAQTREPTTAERYVRVRAADAMGDFDTATRELAVLLERDPTSTVIAQRAYREAISAGDRTLGEKAAHALDAQNALPPDGPVLLAALAIRAHDWKAARAQIDRFEQGKLFTFLAPLMRAWVAQGAGDLDPLAVLDTAKSTQLSAGYVPTERALLLTAMGRTEEGSAQVRTLLTAGSRLKLIAAAALARQGKKDLALQTLAGDDPVLVTARAQVNAGKPIALAPEDAAEGVADMLVQVALDFDRQRLAPVALILARIASFASPGNSGAWIAIANLLGTAHQQAQALAALDHVAADDPFFEGARTLRVALLVDKGDNDGALAVALAAADRPNASVADWARVGDLYQALDRPADAALAYGKAIALAGNGSADQLWPLWLQQGNSLELAGDWSHAKAALTKAYSLAPQQPVVLNHLGYSKLSRREDIPGASRLIEQASKLRPDDPAITDSLGWSYYVRGDAAAAVSILERASHADPGEPTINEHLGDAYWTVGRQIEARYAWRAALVTAEDKDAARIRTKLDGALTVANGAP